MTRAGRKIWLNDNVYLFCNGFALTYECSSHGDIWCSCRSKFLKDEAGTDADSLWRILVADKGTLKVKVPLTLAYVPLCTVLVDDDASRARVYLPGEFLEHQPFDTVDVVPVGWLYPSEGVAVIRDLIVNRMDSVFAQQPMCRSPRHTAADTLLIEEATQTRPGWWDLKLATFLYDGLCPPCYRRYEAVMQEYGTGVS